MSCVRTVHCFRIPICCSWEKTHKNAGKWQLFLSSYDRRTRNKLSINKRRVEVGEFNRDIESHVMCKKILFSSGVQVVNYQKIIEIPNDYWDGNLEYWMTLKLRKKLLDFCGS